MPTDTAMTEAMHAVRDALAPDPATTERMLERVHAMDAIEAGDAPRVAAPRRRRRLVASLATVALVAAGVVAAVAIAPGDSDRVGPTSARAALLDAGAAAGTQPWTPFGTDDYHHVYTLGIVPDWPDAIDVVEPGAAQHANTIMGSQESWTRIDGTGIRAEPFGFTNTDPHRFVTASFNTKTGAFSGFGMPGGPVPHDVDAAHPAVADAVDVTRIAATGSRRETWLRTPVGYRKYADQQGYVRPVPGATPAEAQQVEDWGATAATVARLNAATGDALDDAVADVLDNGGELPSRTGELQDLVPGRFGETEESLLAESRVERATTLLARAPLAPAVRRMLFTQLAQLPGAKIDGPQEDATGRRGVGVTFSRFDTVEVPARTADLAELKAQAIRLQFPRAAVDAFEPDVDALTAPAHTERRWWYVHVVFDRSSGQVLQVARYSRYSSVGSNPHIEWVEQGADRRLGISARSVDGLEGDSTVFVSRDRSTPEEATSTYCRETPVMCSDAGADEPIVTRAEDARIAGRN